MFSPSAPPKPELADGPGGVGQQPLLVGRVGPRPGHDGGAVQRPEVLLVGGDDGVDGVGRDEAPLDEQRLEGGHPLLDGRRLVGMVAGHEAAPRYESHRSR